MLEEEGQATTVALSSHQLSFLSQIVQDLRTTLSHMRLPKVSPLAALDATAIDALKDLYYLANTEDPLNTLPLRRHLLQAGIPANPLLPLISLLHSDPAAATNPKRWSVPMYQSLRLLSVLSAPISRENGLLPSSCALDESLLSLRGSLADSPSVVSAYVALLQYYLDRKARKADALAAAEDARLEDARIDCILRFFRNLLSGPRASAEEHVHVADRGVHHAVVTALVKADFFATLTVMFSSKEDARSQYTDLVFLVADIYSLTFRHATPKLLYHAYRSMKAEKAKTLSSAAHQTIPAHKSISKARRSESLRAAVRRERAVIGGSRAVRASARWTNRHSGGFTEAPKSQNKTQLFATKKIISARNAVQCKLSFNPKRPLQESIRVNSEILCLVTAKKRSKRGVVHKKKLASLRKDVHEEGLRNTAALTIEFTELSFQFFARELRERIDEMKERSKAEETETLVKAQRSFVGIVGSIVGFHRERSGKVFRDTTENPPSLAAPLHENCMKAVLASDFKVVRTEWKVVEAGIELESFQLVFRILVESCEALREAGKDDQKVQTVEVSTFAVLEMMKLLQGMASSVNRHNEEQSTVEGDSKQELTPREIALNTLEQLFERQAFLNAPAELAKDFSAKLFSFRHLTNIVEIAHAFTSILLDEQELARLQVTKKRRPKSKKTKANSNEHEEHPETAENDKHPESTKHPGNEEEQINRAANQRSKRVKRVVQSDDDEDDPHMSPRMQESNKGDENPDLGQSTETEEDIERSSIEIEALTAAEGSQDDNECSRGGTVGETSTAPLQESPHEDDNKRHEGPKQIADQPEKEDLSTAQRMLQADVEERAQSKAKGRETRRKFVAMDAEASQMPAKTDGEPSVAQDASERALGGTAKEKPLTDVQTMLLADVKGETSDRPMPQLVSTVEAMRQEASKTLKDSEGNIAPEISGQDGNGSDSEDSEKEPELKEIESVGIIRKFAHAKALQSLVLPIRAALCEASALSGGAHPTPEGSSPMLSPVVVAKSAHVLAAIWRVAKIKERGVQCGQFFCFSTMHLVHIIMSCDKEGQIRQESVLGRLSIIARDVAKEFFTWMSINPGMALDIFFPMDKNSCNMYVSHLRQKPINGARADVYEDSGNESDISLLEAEKRVQAVSPDGARRHSAKGGSRKSRKRRSHDRRQVDRGSITEDEDVEDLDNLDIGIEQDDNGTDIGMDNFSKPNKHQDLPDDFIEDDTAPARISSGKRKSKQTFDPFASDDERLLSRRERSKKPKGKKRSKTEAPLAKGSQESKKPTFSSSDEYSDLELEDGMELSDNDDDNPSRQNSISNIKDTRRLATVTSVTA